VIVGLLLTGHGFAIFLSTWSGFLLLNFNFCENKISAANKNDFFDQFSIRPLSTGGKSFGQLNSKSRFPLKIVVWQNVLFSILFQVFKFSL
jgi:hypothetical protein